MTIKEVQIAGNWKKAQVVSDIYGHLELSDVHEKMRQLSRKKVEE